MNRRNTVTTCFLSFFGYIIFAFLTRPNSSFYKKPVRTFTDDQNLDGIDKLSNTDFGFDTDDFGHELEETKKRELEQILAEEEDERLKNRAIPTPPERNPERLKHPFILDDSAFIDNFKKSREFKKDKKKFDSVHDRFKKRQQGLKSFCKNFGQIKGVNHDESENYRRESMYKDYFYELGPESAVCAPLKSANSFWALQGCYLSSRCSDKYSAGGNGRKWSKWCEKVKKGQK